MEPDEDNIVNTGERRRVAAWTRAGWGGGREK